MAFSLLQLVVATRISLVLKACFKVSLVKVLVMAELDFDAPNFPHPSPLESCHFPELKSTCLSFWHLSMVG